MNQGMKSMRSLAFALGVLVATVVEATTPWSPPERPQLNEVRREAREAEANQDWARAAQIRRWYHEAAPRLDQGHGGVRLSFALAEWHALALRYPPALQDMQAARDRAAEWVRSGGANALDGMSDLSAIDEQLADPTTTAKVMAWLDANRPADARAFAAKAIPAVVAVGDHSLALRYLDTGAWLASAERAFATLTEPRWRPKDEQPGQARLGAQRFADKEMAWAVVALVKGGRHAEAQRFVEQLRKALGNDAALDRCQDALRGFVPPFRRY